MKKIALFTVFACIMVILQGCAKDMPTEENKEAVQENSNAYHKIDAKKAKEMMDAGKVTIVDVRTQQEYREKLIPDAVLVPNETIEDEAKDKLPDTDAGLIVHCPITLTSWYRWDIGMCMILVVSMTGRMIP